MDSSSNADSTITHVVGFTFSTPKPQLSGDGIPQFNAAEAMQEGVFQDGGGIGDPNAPIPPNKLFKNNLVDERPILPPTPPTQVTDLAAPRSATGEPDAWDQAKTAWLSVDEAVAADFTSDWSGLFGWPTAPTTAAASGTTLTGTTTTGTTTTGNTTTGGTTTGTTPMMGVVTSPAASTTGNGDDGAPQPLSAKKPLDIIDDIGNYYLSAPFLSAVPAPVVVAPIMPVAPTAPVVSAAA
jgi:hypothetical protein